MVNRSAGPFRRPTVYRCIASGTASETVLSSSPRHQRLQTSSVPDPAGLLRVTRSTPEQLPHSVLDQAAALLQGLVRDGAALGWVDPPSAAEVADLLHGVVADVEGGDAALTLVWSGSQLAGLGYWKRYVRPTQRPHADLEKVAVDPRHQGRGVGRALTADLIAAAAEANVEVLTLDVRGDNIRAARLYESLGFSRYGLLERFISVREMRYDKILMSLDLRR